MRALSAFLLTWSTRGGHYVYMTLERETEIVLYLFLAAALAMLMPSSTSSSFVFPGLLLRIHALHDFPVARLQSARKRCD